MQIITCPQFVQADNVKHGFFTRNGGVSSGIYNSLNLGLGSNDNPDNVKENRKIAIKAFSEHADAVEILETGSLHTLNQIHSDKVITITDKFEGNVEADALVTNTPNIILGILTADCTPVLFADDRAKVIGAAHAGWKGACSGILENTVQQMKKLGAKNIKAVIGPTISQSSYEVGPEFYQRFIDLSQENQQFFIDSKKTSHYMFDLPGYVTSRLTQLNLELVSNVKRDTCSDKKNFFSYRRSTLAGEKDYGRNLSVISIVK